MASSSTWADTADVASRIFASEKAAWRDGREVGGRRRPAAPPRGPEPARGQRAALTSPICSSTSSSSSRVSPPGSSGGRDPSLPPQTLRSWAPGDLSGTAAGGSGPASAMSRSALPPGAPPARAPPTARPGRSRRAPPAARMGRQRPRHRPAGGSGSCSPAAGTGRSRGRRAGAAGPRPAGCARGGRRSERCPGPLRCCSAAARPPAEVTRRGRLEGLGPGPRPGLGRAGLGWDGRSWGGWGRRLARRRGRAKVAAGSRRCPGGRGAGAGPAGGPVAPPRLPLPGASVRPEAAGQRWRERCPRAGSVLPTRAVHLWRRA